MTKPKDPEVIEEMRAAGREPEEETLPENLGGTEDSEPEADAVRQPASGAGDDTEHGETEDDDAIAASETDDEPHILAAADYQGDEATHRSLAATALMVLVGIIAIAAGTLWAAPRVAPHLPAAIGQYLMPGQLNTAAEIAALRQELDAKTSDAGERIAALQSRLDAAESALSGATKRLDDLPDTQAATANAAKALELGREASAQAATLAQRADATASELASLRESLTAVSTALAGGGGNAAPTEVSAAVAAMNARLDSLAGSTASRADLRALESRIDAFATRLDAIETSAAAARGVQSQALDEVSTAIRQASLRSAIAGLTSRVEGGQPYAAPMDEVTALNGATPPPALAAGAETGLATPAALDSSFGPYAQAAIAADMRSRTGDDTASKVLGWLRAQVAARPVTEQAGEDVGAITSRIAARVREGALAEALSEAETLPPPAQAALGTWLDQLRARVEAEAALATWLAEIDANG